MFSAQLWQTTIWPDGEANALLEPRSPVPFTAISGTESFDDNGTDTEFLWSNGTASSSNYDYGDCGSYMNFTGCQWTELWSCPGQQPGLRHLGNATDDGSDGFHCCCERGFARHQLSFEVAAALQSGVRLQTMVGFGLSMPQASARVLHDLKVRSRSLYSELMRKLFGDSDGEARINMVRFPIGSCDYAMSWSTWDDTPGDYNLTHLAPDRDTELIIEVLKDAKSIRPNLVLLASPWSPPPWLKKLEKTAGLNNNNTLMEDNATYDLYADYLYLVARTMSERGLPLQYMTLQNEPLNGVAQYPGMFMPPGSEARLGRLLRERLLVSQNSSEEEAPKLLAFDHNWEAVDYPLNLERTMHDGIFAGTALHCYGKDDMVEAQDALHDAFPQGEIHMTECVGDYGPTCDIDKGMEHFGYNHEWDMSMTLLGNAAHWGQSSLKWLSVLDEHCGPSLLGPSPEGAWHGRPVVTVPSDAQTLLDIRFNQDYWTLSHMSRFVQPGSQRLLTLGERQGSIMEAFRDEVAGTVTLIVVNRDHAKSLTLSVTYGTCGLRHTVPEWGTAVLVWPEAACLSADYRPGFSGLQGDGYTMSFVIQQTQQAWQSIALVGLFLAVLVTMLIDGLRWRSSIRQGTAGQNELQDQTQAWPVARARSPARAGQLIPLQNEAYARV